MEPVLTLTDTPTPEQERVINAGLSRFNEEKAGYYRAFGTIDCHPAGTSRIYMTKTLDADAGPPREPGS
jgi:hypothetical protein